MDTREALPHRAAVMGEDLHGPEAVFADGELVAQTLVQLHAHGRWERTIENPLDSYHACMPGSSLVHASKRTMPCSRAIGRFLVRGLFDGEHSFRIEPLDKNRSRFIQSERFSGILIGAFKSTLDKTEIGLEQMNAALKAQAEDR